MNARLRALAEQIQGRPMVKTVVPILVLVLVATVLATNPPAQPVATSGPGSPIAGASPTTGAGDSPTPTAIPEPWEDLVLGPIEMVASITPIRQDRVGVATTSGFTLRSLGATSAAELAKGVSASPALDFRIRPGSNRKEVVLEPTEAMLAGTTYRFTLTRGDGGLGGSWAFRTQRPLQIVTTVPRNERTGVPVDTGIEITFDQDGTIGLSDHFRIEPGVAGRFEQHGRTWAFVPDQPLEHAAAYRVTVTPGVGLQGSRQELEAAVTFAFETEPEPGPREHPLEFTSPMSAARPDQQPALLVAAGRKRDRPDTAPTRIFRLPDLETTLAAAERLTGPDSWLRVSGLGLFPTDGLERVASLDAPLLDDEQDLAVLSLPMRLDAGAYLVVVPRRTGAAQLVLQVSYLSAYAVSTETRTLAWVNNLASVAPVAGATVSMPGGRELGTTDRQGLAQFATPADLLPRPAPGHRWRAVPHLLAINAPGGRWIVAALGSHVSWLDGEYDNMLSQARVPSERYWLVLNTDRQVYRQTDTIHVWGVARSRDDGTLPGNVEVRLRPGDDDAELAIAQQPVRLTGRGAFIADIPIANLPFASYTVDLLIDGRLATSQWLDVADIRKPSYRLEVETDRHAYLAGDPLAITVRATFFDGSPVPGVELTVRASEGGGRVTVTTDAAGVARTTLEARFTSDQPWSFNNQSIRVRPARPEEGQINADADVIVFPSTAWLTARAALDGSTLTVRGTMTQVEFDDLNATYDPENWNWPYGRVADGRPLAGRTVTLRVTQVEMVRVQAGTRYDYLEKRVTPVYKWDEVETSLGTFDAKTGSDGRYRLALTVPSRDSYYQIHLEAADAAGRPVVASAYAQTSIERSGASSRPFLIRGFCGSSGFTVAGLDEALNLTFHNGDGRAAAEGRFLWLVGSRGLRDVATTDDSSFSRRVRSADLPGFTVRGVQVTGEGYATADAFVSVDLDDLTIDVRIKPDREHYAPGSRATVEIRTIGPDGRPIAADVIVQGVDEKLYAIGAAAQADVLAELHQSVSNGFLQSFASHRIPSRSEEGGCGATGGGGPRDDFGDVVTFQVVHTGADGRATASFDLLDDLTSWRITGMAVTHDLKAGVGWTLLPVSLPFFVESVLAPEYLVGEAPVLRLRAYGEALAAGDAVRFTVDAESLAVEDQSVGGVAFQAARVSLPELPLGTHRIRIDAYGPGNRHDAVIRVINVIPSRLAALVTEYEMLTADFVPRGSDGLTRYTISDAGRGSLVGLLVELASTRSGRFDSLAAASAAREMLIDEFGFDSRELREVAFNPRSFDDNGVALLPFSGRDLQLSALAALLAPDAIDANQTRFFFTDQGGDDPATREAQVIALAGRAGLGDDVLLSLRAMAQEDLTIRERLWLALGLAAAGDENGARDIERTLLDEHGQRLGPWVRLEVGGSLDDTVDAGRLLLVLSARLGEPFARDVARYLVDHPTRERSIALEQLAYVRAMLERMPRTPTRFAWTVDGERHEVRLKPGRSWSIVVTPLQQATLRLQPLEGDMAVVTSYTGTGAPLPSGDLATIGRAVVPANNASERQLVRVVITVSFGSFATNGCWLVTDVVPSGLQPLSQTGGQEVSRCFDPRDDDRTFKYTARVVSPGSYTWEPAIIQSIDAPEVGAATKPFVFTIE